VTLGLLARARKALGKLRLTFGLGPSGGVAPEPQPVPLLCPEAWPAKVLELVAATEAALLLEPEAGAALELETGLLFAAEPALLLEVSVEAC